MKKIMRNHSRGFIAIPLVLSIIIFATVLAVFILNKFSTSNYYMSNITKDVKKRLSTTKNPNCTWSQVPYMRIINDTDPATGSIVLTCFHIDGISTDILNLKVSDLDNYFQICNSETNICTTNTNSTNLKLVGIHSFETASGYKMVFETQSAVIGKYYLKLLPAKIMTKAGYSNLTVDSKEILITK